MTDITLKVVEDYVKSLPKKVSQNLTVKPFDGYKALHISRDPKIKGFLPVVSKRVMKGEDNSVPRVSVSSTISGCFHGYQATIYDFMDGVVSSKDFSFDGGWYIYGIDYDYSLKPNGRLLPDVGISDEEWLPEYTKGLNYPTSIVGKVVPLQATVKHIPTANDTPKVAEFVFYIEVNPGNKIKLDKDKVLTEGFWEFKLTLSELEYFNSLDKVDFESKIGASELRPINKADFLNLKRQTTSMESNKDFDIPKDHGPWKEIPGYSGYLASAEGHILTKKTGNFTKGGVAGTYRKVKVYKDKEDKPHLQYAHILVCLAFHGKPKDGMVVLHLDNDPLNNSHDNLEWGSQSKNIQQVYDDGLKPSKESLPASAGW